jgi:hypothetical protein
VAGTAQEQKAKQEAVEAEFDVEDVDDVQPSPPPLPKPAPEKPKHLAGLVAQAKDFGFAQEQIDGYTPEQLADLVYHLNRRERDLRSQQPSTPAAVPPPPPVDPPQEEDFSLDLDEEEVNPQIAGALKKLHEHANKQIKGLKDQLGSYEKKFQEQEQREYVQHVNQTFDAMNNPLFGQTKDVPPGTPEAIRRVTVHNYVAAQQNDNRPLDVRLKEATAILFPGEVKASANPEPSAEEKQRKWAEGQLARTTQRNGSPEPKGPTKAARVVQEKMRAKGFDTMLHVESEEDELPG